MTFGIDIGTTSVAGVAVDEMGRIAATATVAHAADVSGLPEGTSEQDPLKLLAAVDAVEAELARAVGKADGIGWTGQMHGVVAVDRDLKPLTGFVTWRDARRYGGAVMDGWGSSAFAPKIFKCLPVCGLAIARRTGKCVIDPTFLESWHLEGVKNRAAVSAWLPETVEGSMLGDNQAGVFAAQTLLPGCAVVNLGTSGQLSVVVDGDRPPRTPENIEVRLFPGSRWLLCRASLVGGKAWADLHDRLGVSWEEMNSGLIPEAVACARRIVDDLFSGMDLGGVSGLIGVGNALVRNPILRRAVEERFGLKCVIPEVAEMAAYGAALHQMKGRSA